MTPPPHIAWFCLMIAVPWWGGGCGGKQQNGNLPETYSVSGVVTWQGQPLDGAILNFQRVDGSRGAVGRTNAQGKYRLTTFKSNDGVVPGEYHVVIVKYEIPPATPSQSEDETPPAANIAKIEETEEKNLLPARYANPRTSGLTATVTEGKNIIDFHLTR